MAARKTVYQSAQSLNSVPRHGILTLIGYQMEAFLDFYRTGLHHILEINKKGYNLVEIYTKILLQKILTPDGTGYVDLQSPSGAGLNVLVYNYDGDVYATTSSSSFWVSRDLSQP